MLLDAWANPQAFFCETPAFFMLKVFHIWFSFAFMQRAVYAQGMHASNYCEYRCSKCQKLLFKGVLIDSEVEVKCKGCHALSVFKGVNANELLCMIPNCPRRARPMPEKS